MGREIVRRVPPNHQRLVQVRLEGQLLGRGYPFLGDAPRVRLLVLGVVEIWKMLIENCIDIKGSQCISQ